MSQPAGRVVCRSCGANNFDNMTACWQCNALLNAANISTVPTSPAASYRSEKSPAIEYEMSPAAKAALAKLNAPVNTDGDSAVAKRAAFYLALTFPYFGLPIGWAFMMIEDRRRQAIGRYCVQWSIGSLVVQMILLFMTAMTMGSLVTQLTPNLNVEKQLESQIKGYGGGANGNGVNGLPGMPGAGAGQ